MGNLLDVPSLAGGPWKSEMMSGCGRNGDGFPGGLCRFLGLEVPAAPVLCQVIAPGVVLCLAQTLHPLSVGQQAIAPDQPIAAYLAGLDVAASEITRGLAFRI